MSYIIQHRPLCLASSSTRRLDLLKRFSLQFECRTPKVKENPENNESAKSFVKRMASEKALQVRQKYSELAENVIILAGDTIVYCDGQIFGKPKTAQHAESMLTQFSGQTHQVFTGFSIFDSASGREITDVICTEVNFIKLNKDLLKWYANSGEPFGKAGAYSIQGIGTIFIKSISGSYNNVVGFPIECIIPLMTANGWISYAENHLHGASA